MKMVAVRTKLSFCAHEDGAGKQGCAHEDREDLGVHARCLRAHRIDLGIWAIWVEDTVDLPIVTVVRRSFYRNSIVRLGTLGEQVWW